MAHRQGRNAYRQNLIAEFDALFPVALAARETDEDRLGLGVDSRDPERFELRLRSRGDADRHEMELGLRGIDEGRVLLYLSLTHTIEATAGPGGARCLNPVCSAVCWNPSRRTA